MGSKDVVKSFLRAHGKIGPLIAGPGDEPVITPEQQSQLSEELRKIAARNAPVLWIAVFTVVVLSAVGFAVAVALGGTQRMAYLAGLASALCIPIAGQLRTTWREKQRVEVLLCLLPLLPPTSWLDALERFIYNDWESSVSRDNAKIDSE